MHIETLKTFCDIVETGSFTEAAARGRVTQSAVSQQVRALEARYGSRLLERGPRRGVRPTAAGRLLYEAARAVVARLGELDRLMGGLRAAPAGVVRLATVYSTGLYELPPHIKQFLRAHARVDVRVEYTRTDRVYAACRSGAADLGLVALPSPRPGLEVIRLRDDELVLVCPPGRRFPARRPVPVAALEGEPFVAFDRDIPTRRFVDAWLRGHRVRPRRVAESDNIESIKRSVEAGLGVSILPRPAVEHEARARSLRALPFAEGPLYRPLGLLRRKGRELSPPARALLEFLRRAMG
ncbi:MAG TPA: LysR family transcriptional regulator [Polyangiaceae bacterium]|nr:LysR family transcriptional regulator [Polyangiaceae bacterium]